jgi:hypothetical protein
MRRAPLLAFTLGCLWLGGLGSAVAQCGDTAQDRLVWARERMHPGVGREQLREVYQWLLNATSSCRNSGDLWYFRGLVANRLSEAADAGYAFKKARENESIAQRENFDPFFVVDRSSSSKPSGPQNRFALLVGISNFQNSDDFLRYGAKDAHDLRDFLVSSAGFHQDHITVLTDENATTEKIREAFGTIRSQAKPNDLVLVYFSTHGKMRELDPTGLSYVLTYDTNEKSAGSTFATSLQMVELAELGRWTLARDYVLLLDTCLSGAARAEVAGNDFAALQGLKGSGNRIVISASRADEKSYEDDTTKHGYFTRFLLEALRQNSSSATLNSVYSYLQSHVPSQVAKDQGKEQHPIMQEFGEGSSIVLAGTANSAQASATVPPPNPSMPASRHLRGPE